MECHRTWSQSERPEPNLICPSSETVREPLLRRHQERKRTSHCPPRVLSVLSHTLQYAAPSSEQCETSPPIEPGRGQSEETLDRRVQCSLLKLPDQSLKATQLGVPHRESLRKAEYIHCKCGSPGQQQSFPLLLPAWNRRSIRVLVVYSWYSSPRPESVSILHDFREPDIRNKILSLTTITSRSITVVALASLIIPLTQLKNGSPGGPGLDTLS